MAGVQLDWVISHLCLVAQQMGIWGGGGVSEWVHCLCGQCSAAIGRVVVYLYVFVELMWREQLELQIIGQISDLLIWKLQLTGSWPTRPDPGATCPTYFHLTWTLTEPLAEELVSTFSFFEHQLSIVWFEKSFTGFFCSMWEILKDTFWFFKLYFQPFMSSEKFKVPPVSADHKKKHL